MRSILAPLGKMFLPVQGAGLLHVPQERSNRLRDTKTPVQGLVERVGSLPGAARNSEREHNEDMGGGLLCFPPNEGVRVHDLTGLHQNDEQ